MHALNNRQNNGVNIFNNEEFESLEEKDYNLQNKGVNIFNNEEFESLEEKDNKIISNGIYTTPEISSIGKTEQELTKEGITR